MVYSWLKQRDPVMRTMGYQELQDFVNSKIWRRKMNERQAVKFWNSIAQGELIQEIPSTDVTQGYTVFKPTYTSTICDQFDLKELTVPRVCYNYHGEKTGTLNPLKDDAVAVANFLRNLANAIESSVTVEL